MTEKDRGQGDMPEKNRLLDCRLKTVCKNKFKIQYSKFKVGKAGKGREKQAGFNVLRRAREISHLRQGFGGQGGQYI